MQFALGFRVEVHKWMTLVRLLLGDIPERSSFTHKGMAKPLLPYFEITQVRACLCRDQNLQHLTASTLWTLAVRVGAVLPFLNPMPASGICGSAQRAAEAIVVK